MQSASPPSAPSLMKSASQPSSPTSRRHSAVASPTSPVAQPHSRRSSLYSPAASRRTSRRFDTDGHSPYSSYSPATTDHYRRSSLDSTAPYHSASTYRRLSTDTSSLHSPGPGDGAAHESLADELANAWDEDEGIGDEDWEPHTPQPATSSKRNSNQIFVRIDEDHPRDSGIDVTSSPTTISPAKSSSPVTRPLRPRHTRTPSAYEHEREREKDKALADPDGLGASLERRIADISALAAYDPDSTANTSSTPFGDPALDEKPDDEDKPVARLAASLQSLHMSTAQQSALETYTTRLISTSTSLATHLTAQTRSLHSLSFPLFSPLAPAPDPDEVEALLPLLNFAPGALPVASAEPLAGMAGLAGSTAAAVESLAALGDSLHLSRQTLATAARRLRTAKEAVAELRREDEGFEGAVRWIEEGDWDTRLRERRAGRMCQDVVGGFERVCGEWRERLAQGQGVPVR